MDELKDQIAKLREAVAVIQSQLTRALDCELRMRAIETELATLRGGLTVGRAGGGWVGGVVAGIIVGGLMLLLTTLVKK